MYGAGWDRPAPDPDDIGVEACEDYLESCGHVVHSDERVAQLVARLESYAVHNWDNPMNEQMQGRQCEIEDILEGYFGFTIDKLTDIKVKAIKKSRDDHINKTIGLVG